MDDPKDARPILLHEYMHVYHFRKLPGGLGNPDILTFYGRAKGGGFYPTRRLVLKNQGEFFAMTASVNLHGRLAREPFHPRRAPPEAADELSLPYQYFWPGWRPKVCNARELRSSSTLSCKRPGPTAAPEMGSQMYPHPLRFGQTARSGRTETAIEKLYLSHPAIDAQFGTCDEARLVA